MRPPQLTAHELGYSPIGSDETLYFLHIGKTAGTSLKNWLVDHFQHEETLLYPSPEELSQQPRALVEEKRFVVGHFDTRWWGHYRRPEHVVTWLRDPLERTLSQYYFSRAEAPRPGHRGIDLAHAHDLEDCLANHEYQRISSNAQIRSLAAGATSPELYFLSESEQVSRALSTLLELEFFGLVERMQASVDMLNWRYGWRPVSFDRRDNVTAKRAAASQISQQAHALVTQMNRLDQQLYDAAAPIFEERFQAFLREVVALGEHVGVTCDSAETLSSLPYEAIRQQIEPILWERYRWTTQELPRQCELTYTFDQPMLGDGWREREGSKTLNSLIFRWMRQKRASLDLPLQRDQPLKVRFRVAHTFGQEIELFAGDQPLGARAIPTWDRFGIQVYVYEADLPPCDDWEPRLTTLTFVVPELVRPCDRIPGCTDNRALGVALDWLQVVPA